ncbi:MMPL family transporter [Actinocorallia longicatena]|uniref:MMPL family transporter n=1 Tax=Actinocorallia longicatena TaxID=111803 RepID=A0ABP6Q3I1_9ACTN
MRALATLPAGRRAKWLVLVVWLAALAFLVPLGGKLGDAQENDAAAWLPGGAESTQVLELQKKFETEETSLAIVIYERQSGLTPADQAKAKADAAAFASVDGVAGPVTGPIVSKDGKAVQVLFPVQAEKEIDATDAARDVVKRGPPQGLDIQVTGPVGSAADQIEVFESLDGFLLMAAGIVVVFLLLIIYRSPILWLVPVFSAVAALMTAMAVVYLLADKADVTVNGQSAGVLNVLVFGVATDYALLLVARYREELHRHPDKHQAMAIALRKAGPAILASAATVAAGLLCLMVAELNSTAGLGPVAAAGVLCSLLAMTTLLPALLVIMPRAIFWPVVPRFDTKWEDPEAFEKEHGIWSRVARLVSSRPRVLWIGTAVVLGVMMLGMGALNTAGFSNKGAFVDKPDSIIGEEMYARHFPVGTGSPVVVIAKAAEAAPLKAAIAGTKGIAEPGKETVKGDLVRYEALLSDKGDSKEAEKTIERLRTNVHAVQGADAKVGGMTAATLDIKNAAGNDNLLIIPIVLVVVVLILIGLLRSLIAPLLMMATVVASFLATLGACGLIFKYVFDFEAVDPGFPLLAFIFLVALGVDYNIFLMHRVREESQSVGTRRGIVRGLTVTGGVITSAGLVLAATFAALTVLPLVGMVEMGFVVAFGVLFDTLIVRSLLLPALAFDLGSRIWWPSRLAAEPGPDPLEKRTLERVS